MQLKNPAWSCFGCKDQMEASVTRKKVLAQCVDLRATLLPAHFMAPFGGHLKPAGEGYQWDAPDA